MADSKDDRPRTATQDYAVDTRRTSVSSAMTNPTRDGQSMDASTASLQSDSAPRNRQGRPPPRALDYGSYRSQAMPPATPKRPKTLRQSSTARPPHRGEVFSVDDEPEEIDLDKRLARDQKRWERERQLRRRESTLRRRGTAIQVPTLATVQSEDREGTSTGNDATPAARHAVSLESAGDPSSEETLQGEEEEAEDTGARDQDATSPDPEEDDADLSDAESFTLKDRQEAINETHPFGIRIWKPALYKKNRSVQRNAEGDIHSAPGGRVSRWLFVFNILWSVLFGWWLCLVAGIGGVLSMALSVLQIPGCDQYGRVLLNLAHYLFYPFGKYVELEKDEAYLHEDEGEGRSISEYERWQTGDLEEGRLFFGPPDINRSIIGRRRDEVEDAPADETDSLLGRSTARPSSTAENARNKTKKRLFGRGQWNIGRVIFFLSFYCLIAPCLFVVSGLCWFMVFTIPMGKVTLLVFYHMRRHPLALSFHTDSHYSRIDGMPRAANGSVILLCTYRAVGLKYWKYTIDGTNIFLINLLGLVIFAIFDFFVLYEALGIRTWLTAPGLVFVLALASIIPLAYFIGQAVASISAQSSMGVGATVNAFFSTVVEVFLYCVALSQGKASLVEGSIVGSIFAGILFLPGLSMCFGAIKRKTQRFNVKSAGVTSTLLLFAAIGAFGPTLFYQIYGSHELNCHQCINFGGPTDEDRDCRRCYFSQVPAIHDQFFVQAVRPYIWFACVCLFFSYVVGLMFTLRTHAAVIWNNEPDEKREGRADHGPNRTEDRQASLVPGSAIFSAQDAHRPSITRDETSATLAKENIRDSQMYRRILTQSLKQVGTTKDDGVASVSGASQKPHIVPPKSSDGDTGTTGTIRIDGLSLEDNRALVQQVAEIAATAATVAARDATRAPRRASHMGTSLKSHKQQKDRDVTSGKEPGLHRATNLEPGSLGDQDAPAEAAGNHHEGASGGHDAPNWSRTKSIVILLTATVAYAVIAEILVDTVDAVLSNIDIDEKFLGITLFALVPNTTEFLNAISFAMNGNVALSMEIGSSYALQVMLLQIPCLVLFSGIFIRFIPEDNVTDFTFNMIFPQWDMVVVILGVFLMGWILNEGKSNYFKGSILIFSYLVITVGFYFSGLATIEVSCFPMLASRPTLQSLICPPSDHGCKSLRYSRHRPSHRDFPHNWSHY
nr:low affinity vacuolar monovalent cation/h(+) antiporter [Quercus suber]